jgi:hypothetical protein
MTESTPSPGTAQGAGTSTGSDWRQRFGRIVHRGSTGAGPHQVTATYTVRDDADGSDHDFDYSDIVTEGFRTVVLGERVRYEIDDADRARYIIRLDLPEDEQFYR